MASMKRKIDARTCLQASYCHKRVNQMKRIILLNLKMGTLQVQTWFDVVQNLKIDTLLGTKYIHLNIKGIFPKVRKTVLIRSAPLLIFWQR